MNALAKNVNRKRNEDKVKQIVKKNVDEYFLTIREKMEAETQDRILFFYQLALSMTAREKYNFGDKRCFDLIESVSHKANELSEFLTSNKCIDKYGKEQYDVDYNIEMLKRLANENHIPFNEILFTNEVTE